MDKVPMSPLLLLLSFFLQTLDANCPSTPTTVPNATPSPTTCPTLTPGAICTVVKCNTGYNGTITLTCGGTAWTVSGTCTKNTAIAVIRSPSSTLYFKDTVYIQATVTFSSGGGIPTGTVDFKNGANVLQSGVTINSTGGAMYVTSSLPVTTTVITVSYPEQNGNTYSSNSVSVAVSAWTTTTALSYTPTASTSLIFGTPVVLVATVSTNKGLPPFDGYVQFKRGAVIISNVNVSLVAGSTTGVATLSSSDLLLGSNSVTAVFMPPNNTITTSTSTTSAIIMRAASTTVVTAVPISSDTVNLTATITSLSGVPAGSVSWRIGGITVTTTTAVAGSTSLSFTLEPGPYQFSAQFLQSTQHFVSTSANVGVIISAPATPGFPLPATIDGPFTVGCYLQLVVPGAAYIWHCPPSSALNLIITGDTSSGSGSSRIRQFSCAIYVNSTLTQNCGLVFKPAGYVGPKVLDYMWVGSSTTRKYPGVVANLVVTITQLLYSGDQQQCVWWPLWRPPVDGQYCAPGLTCYFKNASDVFIGEGGQCWYPYCTPLLCSMGARYMQDAYCRNDTGSWMCESYKLPGDNCTLSGGGWGVHPICSPWQSFCLPADATNTTGVCVHSDCLDGGCRYGSYCTPPGTEADPLDECRGNHIPNVPATNANGFLNEIDPNATLPLFLQSTMHHLQTMARIRKGNERGHQRRWELMAPKPCTSARDCGSGTSCVGSQCTTAPQTGCTPNLGGCN